MRCLRLSLAIASLLCAGPAGLVAAERGAAENLLIDGSFEAEQAEFPEFWSASSARDVVYDRRGGPGGMKASIGLLGKEAGTKTVSVRQQDLTLVPGEPYKISGYIRTQAFQSRSAGLIVHNSGWLTASGLTKLPADSEWTYLEKTFTLFPSKDNRYGVAMYAVEPRGEVHFAEIKLEALSQRAREGSRSNWSAVVAPRLVPYQPLLHKIPQAEPRLVFKFFGSLPEPREAYECVVTVRGNHLPPQTLPLVEGKLVVPLAGLECGEYSLEAVLQHRETREQVLQAAYPIRIVDLPAIDRSRIRPLNNLVAELLDAPLRPVAEPQTFSFVNPRDGWVFVALVPQGAKQDGKGGDGADPPDGAAGGAGEEDALAVQIDAGDPVITATTERGEAFRELPRGEHRITVSGNAAAARLLVRSIPEIFNYPPCANSQVAENGRYDWDFMKRHVLHAVTTLNGGQLPGDALPEAKARGLKWLANFNVAPVDDPDSVRKRMEQHPGMTQPQYDGLTSDELFFGRATIANYSAALWQLQNPQDRLVYTWIVGKPSMAALDTDFLSACINVSRSRGRLLFEAYCHPQADEAAAADYLDDKIGETMRLFNAYFPQAAAGTGIIFGNFNQIPIISLEHNPAVDFKYFLDMQVNLIANSPDFADLATTGYWGTYYGDEELARWSFLLMRHYAVEGRRDMLSARYGFQYNPGFLANGDFADGLKSWDTAPAAEDAIRPATIDGYGQHSQGRWGAGRAGDTACVLTRQAERPNRLSQTATGLKVGQAYCLQFVTADLQDVTDRRYNPRRYGIDAELDGAEILADRSFVHIDRRQTHRSHDAGRIGKINLHRLVFRARTATQTIAFHDERARPGEALLLNFVQLKPYLE